MFIWSIAAILIVALTIAHCQEKKLVETLGLTCLGYILVMYILAFFKVLSWIDYISIAALVGCILWIAENGLFRAVAKKLFTAQNFCVIIFLVLLVFSQYFRIASDWWDIAYGAGDARGLWLLNGFAAKAGNVSPEFGDYPPAVQLFKWFFLHMSADYQEGLGFAGYICLNFILMLPLIGRVDELIPIRAAASRRHKKDDAEVVLAKNKKYYVNDRKLISKYKVHVGEGDVVDEEQFDGLRAFILFMINIVACFLMLLFPSIMGAMCFENTDAAVTMGILFGFLLYYIWDKDDDHPIFFATRVGVYGAVMILCRYTGFIWAVFSVVFMIVCFRYRKRGEKYNQTSFLDINIKCALAVILSWIIVFVSWLLIYIFKGRVSRAPFAGATILGEGNVGIWYRTGAKLPQFLKALVVSPMHTDRFFGIDLSAFAMLIIFVAAVIWLCKKEIIDSRFRNSFLAYIGFIAIAGFGIILLGHLTIWTFEFKYREVTAIAGNIAAYGAPFTTGITILIAGMCLNSVEKLSSGAVTEVVVVERQQESHLKSMRLIYGLLAIFILLTCDYGACYRGLIGYWDELSDIRNEHDQMIDDEATEFIELVNSVEELKEKRILYIRNAAKVRSESNPYISYRVVPVAVVYDATSQDATTEHVREMIEFYNVKYIYVDDIEGTEEAFAPLCDGEYANKRLYRVLPEGKLAQFYATVED